VPFEGLIGNEPALDRLRAALAGGRRAHAWLFSGPEGVGKCRAAMDFARALGTEPRLIEKAEDRQVIQIEQVHEVVRELAMTSAAPRAVIFDDAHRMSEEAMNALLKTLEEPPARTTLVLVTHVPDRLLGTIRSRCQTILFHPVSDAELLDLARKRHGLDEDRARVLALLAGGSVGAASDLAKCLDETIAAARDLQERSVSGELNAYIEALGKIKDTGSARDRAKRDLGLLAQSLREVLRSRAGQRPVLASSSFVEKLKKLDEDEIAARIEVLVDRQRMIDLNANVALAAEDGLLRI
jgi:DNA polymerase III subunit delta'